MSKVHVRNPYNYDVDAVSRETALHCDDGSLTKQSFAEECDINEIVRRFNLTGQLPQDVAVPQYADFEQVFDYQTALNTVIAAQEAFMQMPHDVRSRFSNDPGAFLDFMNDPANVDEAARLGLLVKVPVDNDSGSGKVTPAATPAASTGGNNVNP